MPLSKPSEKTWRTLIRVTAVTREDNTLYVVIPGWDIRREVAIGLKSLPPEIQDLVCPGHRLHAQVNLGAAKDANDLVFSNWEPV